jgi:hypothetical protein
MKRRHQLQGSEPKAWLPMRLEYIGRVDEVLRGGMGKITVPAGDPGEPRKEQPTG